MIKAPPIAPSEMPKTGAFAELYENGSHDIRENISHFHEFLESCRAFAEAGNNDAAAAYGEAAAVWATHRHCGLFSSPELESVLVGIGMRTVPDFPWEKPETPRRILHVFTMVSDIGGHTRMLWRWIRQDAQHTHSVVLTRQGNSDAPIPLREVVAEFGGQIHYLNRSVGGLVAWARKLREIASAADIVVLHVHNYDVIPLIAFANPKNRPPVILLDHADHMFWLGAGISDMVVGLRNSGIRLARERRGVEERRSMLLPIILRPVERSQSREEAKAQLGLPADTVVLLTIARSVKFRTIGGVTFADSHVPLLLRHPNTVLIIVGAGPRDDWSEAVKRTDGRIIVLKETATTTLYYQAADIYVDSFPFVSTTSLLEAASYGTPLVSRHPFPEGSEILSADVPGLLNSIVMVKGDAEYIDALSRLIMDADARSALGEATRLGVLKQHTGANWQHYLNAVYERAWTLPRVIGPLRSISPVADCFPDVLLPSIFGLSLHPTDVIRSELKVMPLGHRLELWGRLLGGGAMGGDSFVGSLKYLAPEWFIRMAKGVLGKQRSWLRRLNGRSPAETATART